MSAEPILGSIHMFAGNFAPKGYFLCAGQLLPINQYAALFSILGTTYGGNGTSNFQLPDLQGRAPIGAGNGQGLSPVVPGEAAGANAATLLVSNMPAHNHLINCDTDPNNTTGYSPANSFIAAQGSPQSGGTGIPEYSAGPAAATMAPTSLATAGNSVPLSIQNPYLGVNFIIAWQGIFPTRN